MEALLETKILDTQFYFVKKIYPCFIKLSKLNKKNIEMDYVVGFDFQMSLDFRCLAMGSKTWDAMAAT